MKIDRLIGLTLPELIESLNIIRHDIYHPAIIEIIHCLHYIQAGKSVFDYKEVILKDLNTLDEYLVDYRTFSSQKHQLGENSNYEKLDNFIFSVREFMKVRTK